MKFENIFESILCESITSVVYHSAPIESAYKILASNTLKSPTGFISTTRSLTGSYHISNRTISVIFEIDGNKINYNMKGSPIGTEDYDDDDNLMFTGKANGQLEDRINTGIIKNFSSFIKRIHIHTPLDILTPFSSMNNNGKRYYDEDAFGRSYLKDLSFFKIFLTYARKINVEMLVHTGKVPNQYSGKRVRVPDLVEAIDSIMEFRDKRYVTEETMLSEAPLPQEWDQNIFSGRQGTYKQMIEYAKARAQQLGKGSSRVAFEVPYQGRKTVLKVALNQGKGLAQNQEESDLLSDYYVKDSGIVIPLIDYDERNQKPTWIHTEYADKITKKQLERFFDGVPIHHVIAHIEYDKTGKKNWAYRELPDSIHDNDSFGRLRDLLLNYTQIGSGDLISKSNWGIYKGKPVIIDLGFTENTMKLYHS